MRKKIMAMSVVMAFLAILYAQSVAAQNDVTIHAWTDRRQYEPGETGTLYITIRNDLPSTDLIIKNVSIIYIPWHAYVEDHWEGNESFTNINQICEMKGGVYYKEVTFTVPTGGRGVSAVATITVKLDKPQYDPDPENVPINVAPLPTTIKDMDVWMTSLTVAMVICTIILAIVVFISTRGARATTLIAPPPPPKAKVK